MLRPDQPLITLDVVYAAAKRLAQFVQRTPVVAMTPSGLRLKAESLHATGAFKMRGAFNSILLLDESQRRRGIVAYSSGNHAQAVAYAAQVLGVGAVVVMPHTAPKAKIDGTLRWGAEVVVAGASSGELAEAAAKLVNQHGYSLIHPFDSERILAASGVIGLELLQQAPDVKVVAAPMGGGGLIAGLAAALKLSNPSVKVIGVEPELSDDAYQSFKAKQLVALSAEEAGRTIADGLRVQQVGALNWRHIQAFVDDVITVADGEICQAVRDIAREARLVSEPSGAVAVAGLTKLNADRARSIAILSGGNIELSAFAAIMQEGVAASD